MSMYLPDVHRLKSQVALENQNISKAKEEIRAKNLYYRSQLNDLEIHQQPNLDIMQRIKELDAENRKINYLNNSLRQGNIEMSSMFRPLADGKFEPRIEQHENTRLKDSYALLQNDTLRLEGKMREKVARNKEMMGRKLQATYN